MQGKKSGMLTSLSILMILVLLASLFVGCQRTDPETNDREPSDISDPPQEETEDNEAQEEDKSAAVQDETDVQQDKTDKAPIVPVSGYFLGKIEDEEIIDAAIWSFSNDEIAELSDKTVESFSPSGRYLFAAPLNRPFDIEDRRPGNDLGQLADYIALYERKDGEYIKAAQIDFDPQVEEMLNDTVISLGEASIAWNNDETIMLIARGITQVKKNLRSLTADIFIVNFTDKTVTNLTNLSDSSEEGTANIAFLPKWTEDTQLTYILINQSTDGSLSAGLMKLDINNGESTQLCDLSHNGEIMYITDYAISNGQLYYCQDTGSGETTGFYSASLDGAGSVPVRIKSIGELQDSEEHPYASSFSSVTFSPDGRYACLEIEDKRILYRDFPLIDHPDMPQSDPAAAISMTTRREWVPCHNVLLYDLQGGSFVNPFTDAALQPYTSVVMTATFAPDGASLLCSVFGDGGVWNSDSFNHISLYQIRLDDESFEASLIYSEDSPKQLTFSPIKWLEDNVIWFTGGIYRHFTEPTYAVIPAAFAPFVE